MSHYPEVCFLLYSGWRQLPFPCLYENELPWGLTKCCGMFLLPAGQLRANQTTLDFHKTGSYHKLVNSWPQNYNWTKLWTLEVSSVSKTQQFSYFIQFKPPWNDNRFPYPREKQTYICSFMVTLWFAPHNFISFHSLLVLPAEESLPLPRQCQFFF